MDKLILSAPSANSKRARLENVENGRFLAEIIIFINYHIDNIDNVNFPYDALVKHSAIEANLEVNFNDFDEMNCNEAFNGVTAQVQPVLTHPTHFTHLTHRTAARAAPKPRPPRSPAHRVIVLRPGGRNLPVVPEFSARPLPVFFSTPA